MEIKFRLVIFQQMANMQLLVDRVMLLLLIVVVIVAQDSILIPHKIVLAVVLFRIV